MATTTTTTSTSTSTSKIRSIPSVGIPRSPRLIRSSSTASVSPQESINRGSTVSLPDIQALGSASRQPLVSRATRSATVSPRPSVFRSRSTMKSRSSTSKEDKEEESYNTIPISKALGSPQRRLSLDKNGDHNNIVKPSNMAKFLWSSSHNMVGKRAGKSLTSSPSAWALSPGRAPLGPPLTPESPKVKTSGSGILMYFNKQKKVSPAQEEELHQYREKLFGVWLKLYKTRYAIAEKKMKVERLKQKIKLLETVCPQLDLLREWEKLEKKNVEAVGRVARKLSAYATKLPLVNGAMGDTVAVFDAMSIALEVMENIEETIMNFHYQAEKLCNLLGELIHTVEPNKGCFQELEKEIASVISLEAKEKSMIVHVLQANKEPEEGQMNCKHHLIRSFINNNTRLAFSMLNVS
ncbi:hypothetical protein Cgig2_020054 [Carnegiea gigantea]|uniref:QWRF motif-containing protein 7 n=1 Tax=Carnegiea gigantea TaxID=171969 RepID=A0A9Q1JJX0_9CARY|nr:hypothetical protein Cgig2_020054 [Carnegiea gigantea]